MSRKLPHSRITLETNLTNDSIVCPMSHQAIEASIFVKIKGRKHRTIFVFSVRDKVEVVLWTKKLREIVLISGPKLWCERSKKEMKDGERY